MEDLESLFCKQRPQSLCKMCGQCCKMSTTSISYSQLKKLCKKGDKYAIDFLEIFEPYDSIEDARKVAPEVVDNIINRLKADENYVPEDMTFYHCRYLGDDNLCTRYETRPLLCRRCPSSPWDIVPPNCGFEGWLFLKREEIKEKVRKFKEELIELKLLNKKLKNPKGLEKISAVENKIRKIIALYKKYGSENW